MDHGVAHWMRRGAGEFRVDFMDEISGKMLIEMLNEAGTC
jgi:hypothetical protein